MGCTMTVSARNVNVAVTAATARREASTSKPQKAVSKQKRNSSCEEKTSSSSRARSSDAADCSDPTLNEEFVVVNDEEEDFKTSSAVAESVVYKYNWIPHSNYVTDFSSEYGTLQRLGRGSTCSVYRCVRMRQPRVGQMLAVKRVPIKKSSSVRREVTALSQCDHPNIVRLEDVFVDDRNFFLVTELCAGGSLIDFMNGHDGVGEAEARRVTIQLLEAVRYLHTSGMIHRDIKPDNIVFADNSRDRVVLIDFGSARELSAMKRVTKDWAGTPAYMAPEMARGRSREDLKAVDMWAVGVTVYVLLTGYLPFFGKNVKSLMEEVHKKKLTWPKGCNVSRSARKFVWMLLRKRVTNRLSVDDAMAHEWVNDARNSVSTSMSASSSDSA